MMDEQLQVSESREMVLGNHAIALGLIDGGIGYVASYPGTPSTEIMEYLVDHKNKYGYHADWATNEAVALQEAISASIVGVDAASVAKSVGLNVAMDGLMTIANSGTQGALVIVIADDPGMHSSQNEQDTRIVAAKFANIPVFEPSTVQEAYYYSRQAILLSRQYKIPVLIRTVTRLSHALTSLQREPPRNRVEPNYIEGQKRFVSIPSNARVNHHNILKTHEKLVSVANEKNYWAELLTDKYPDHLIITSGNTANYVIEAVKGLEISAHIFVPKLIHPMPTDKLNALLETYSSVLIIEELEPYLEEFVRVYVSKNNFNVNIVGKGTLTSREGELTIEKIKFSLIDYFEIEKDEPLIKLPVVDDLLRVRPPVLCAGCPHRSSYVEFGQAIKSFKPIFHNDIGCYSLGVMPPHKSADMLICMGASIPMATATSFTQPERLSTAIIGDSTFWHTGLSGLANAIWKKANILVLVVNNSYTAMTGGQPNPTSHSDEMSISRVVQAMGAQVFEINPMDYKGSKKIIKNAAKLGGVRVIVSSYPCALRKDTQDKEQMKTTIKVVADQCTGCELCISTLGCPAMTMVDGIGSIDTTICNSCGFCQQICRHDAIIRIKEVDN